VPGYDVLHLATHGRLDALNPQLSRIVLAGEPLTYADIPALAPAHTNLVVLSACDTAVGAGGTGVEITGLAYQFQKARVQAVLATLWPVDDRATGRVMIDFYGQLRAGKSYAEALAVAQRRLAGGKDARLRHPAYWAPFVLLGAP
jgi:CHAT domain-containing protein